MRKIILNNLKIENFKGIEKLNITFDNQIQNIKGANGTGKTSVFDSFTWLLFGKNSQYESDFELKPIDKSTKQPKNRLDTSVQGTFIIDGIEIVLKRVYREKWTKKRGNDFEELTGHETDCFIDDVPTTITDFKNYINSIIDEEKFKILSNPLYFNVNLKWEERRNILIKMVGEISNDDILDQITTPNNDFSDLIELINLKVDFKDQLKKSKAKIKILNDELKQLQPRIDEVEHSKPVAENFEEIEAELKAKEKEYQNVDELILDASKVNSNLIDEINKKNLELQNLIQKKNKIENDFNTEKNKQLNHFQNLMQQVNLNTQKINNHVSNCQNQKTFLNNQISDLNNKIIKLREQWQFENQKVFVFDQSKSKCPTCQREVENLNSLINEFETNFNQNKSKILAEINQKGKDLKAQIEQIEKDLNSIDENDHSKLDLFVIENNLSLVQIGQKIKEITDLSISSNKNFIDLSSKIENFEIPKNIKAEPTKLIEQRTNLRLEIDSLKNKLQNKNLIEKANQRIEELNQQRKSLSQEIAQNQKLEMQIEKFEFAKIQIVEEKVNQFFKMVSFKMFENQLNGGVNEVCISTIDGKAFKSFNTALKINAGIDIINGLSKYYGYVLPLFIDSRESVTEIIKTDSQLINLIVDDNFKQLNF